MKPKRLAECWSADDFRRYAENVERETGRVRVIANGRVVRIENAQNGRAFSLCESSRHMPKPEREHVIDVLLALGVPSAIVIAAAACYIFGLLNSLGAQ